MPAFILYDCESVSQANIASAISEIVSQTDKFLVKVRFINLDNPRPNKNFVLNIVNYRLGDHYDYTCIICSNESCAIAAYQSISKVKCSTAHIGYSINSVAKKAILTKVGGNIDTPFFSIKTWEARKTKYIVGKIKPYLNKYASNERMAKHLIAAFSSSDLRIIEQELMKINAIIAFSSTKDYSMKEYIKHIIELFEVDKLASSDILSPEYWHSAIETIEHNEESLDSTQQIARQFLKDSLQSLKDRKKTNNSKKLESISLHVLEYYTTITESSSCAFEASLICSLRCLMAVHNE